MFKLDLEKVEEPEIKLTTSAGSQKKHQILEGKQHGLFLPGCPKPLKNPLASQFAVKAGVSWEGFVPRTHLP